MANNKSKTSAVRKNNDRNLSMTELDTYKQQLLDLRTRIRNDITAMSDGAENAANVSSAPSHMADVGTDNFERDQTLAFIQSDSKTLKLIEEALTRINEGTYGTCEDCGCVIPKARLNVLPFAASCVQCVELAQKK